MLGMFYDFVAMLTEPLLKLFEMGVDTLSFFVISNLD